MGGNLLLWILMFFYDESIVTELCSKILLKHYNLYKIKDFTITPKYHQPSLKNPHPDSSSKSALYFFPVFICSFPSSFWEYCTVSLTFFSN